MTPEVRECLAEMGVTDEVLAKVRACSNHTDGEKALDEAKEVCRRGFRSVAALYHPDQNQHLPADEIASKNERFMRLRSVHDSFMKSRYRGPRRSNVQRVTINFDPFGYSKAMRERMHDNLRQWNNQDFQRIAKEREERRRQVLEILLRDTPKK
jgi:hypothetical protein